MSVPIAGILLKISKEKGNRIQGMDTTSDYLTPEDRELMAAHQLYVHAMHTVEGPTDAQAERLERAKLAVITRDGK